MKCKGLYGGRESSTRCNFRKHIQIKETTSSIWQHTRCKCSQHNQKKKRAANIKKLLQIKKTLSSIWKHTRCKCSQHNQKKKRAENKMYLVNMVHVHNEYLQRVSSFVCVVSICTICCKNDEKFSWFAGAFSICMCFLKLQRVELSWPP